MSKMSPKQRYTQLREWLSTRNTTSSKGTKTKFSKADYYKKTRERYGSKTAN
jgi:hypothetical protein